MEKCCFCEPPEEEIILANEFCLFLQQKNQDVLPGSGVIVPREHRETVFHMTQKEWECSQELLLRAKDYIDEKFAPQGYNVGWNVGRVGGQEIFHAHMHIIPRYSDEPLAGKGIRFWLKQPRNKRGGSHIL